MSAEQCTTSPIELHYTLTSEDLFDGIVAQQRGFRPRWLIALVTVAVLAGLAKGLVSATIWELSAWAVAAVVVVSLVLVLVAAGSSLLLLRVLFAWIFRWQARLIVRGNPWLSQPIRATVTETGVHVSNSTGESRSGWAQYPVYAETDRSFVLLASQRRGAVMLALPKRGLVGSDPAPLRALLATHSHRYG
ncbi:MAG TPA: YcxB family protein [Jiangellaceae bacterium]|nr:YcxB family protein [Jiangellaceae bacterium]